MSRLRDNLLALATPPALATDEQRQALRAIAESDSRFAFAAEAAAEDSQLTEKQAARLLAQAQ